MGIEVRLAASARYAAIRAATPDPELKRCNNCLNWLTAKTDFSWYGKPTVTGEIVRYPMSRCKECESARLSAYRNTQNAEHRRAVQRSYDEKRRHKGRRPRQEHKGEYVDAAPFLAHLANYDIDEMLEGQSRARKTTVRHAITRARERGTISIDAADSILVTIGQHHMLAILYG